MARRLIFGSRKMVLMLDELAATELTLDPADWESFRALAHRMVDDALDEIRTVREKPAYVAPPTDVKRRILDETVPLDAQGEETVYEQFLEDVLPYRNGNIGPRFYGWVMGNGFPMGFMADMLASMVNPHMAGLNQSPRFVEEKVVDWFRELMGFPTTTSGLLLSGGSMANLTGLAVARHAKAGFDLKADGLWDSKLLTVYASPETHSWAKKTMHLFGMGERALRLVPCNPDFTMDIEALGRMVREDKAAGHKPIAVLGTAGTVNTGATDDLDAIADICAEEDLWLHVDGAFGALVAISPKLKHIVKGMERADSVGFDLHKWMYLPFECACLLVRDGEAHWDTFSNSATYLQIFDRGVVAGGIPFADRGIELTRGFKALKAWMSLKAYGFNRFAGLIEQNVMQAQALAEMVSREPLLELTAPVPLNIVCFRFVLPRLSLTDLNWVNQEILYLLQERGIAVPSSTVLDGRFCLRAALVNHRTRHEDLISLIQSTIELGNECVARVPAK
jgi:aromatic-L-amino-acid decarboxylase